MENKLFELEKDKYGFECPGCNYLHIVDATQWSFNNDLVNPTVSPSLLVGNGSANYTCHFFIMNGNIQFLSDCTHKLKNTTIQLPIVESVPEKYKV